MSEYTNSENHYITSACVFGPVIEELTIGPCVNEEYMEPDIEISDENLNEILKKMLQDEEDMYDENLNEILKKMLQDEEDMYDEMIAADRLKDDADYYESEARFMKELEEEIEREEDKMADMDRIVSLYN